MAPSLRRGARQFESAALMQTAGSTGSMDATRLARRFPHARDDAISFLPDEHLYLVNRGKGDEYAPVSVTSFYTSYFSVFDASAVIERCYQKWRRTPESKYYNLIHAVLDTGASEDSAKKAILGSWEERGREASAAGTRMHADLELLLNGCPPGESKEIALFKAWMREFQPEAKWEPLRTEWTIYYELDANDPSSPLLLAGTLDLLAWSPTLDAYGLWDFKRTDPKIESGTASNLLGPHNGSHHPGWARSPLNAVEDSQFGKYTMQLNVLAHILRQRYGLDVQEHLYLLQIHPSLDAAHCVRVEDLRGPTQTLFAIERERLLQKLEQAPCCMNV